MGIRHMHIDQDTPAFRGNPVKQILINYRYYMVIHVRAYLYQPVPIFIATVLDLVASHFVFVLTM